MLSLSLVVFLSQITFLQQNTTASVLELYFNDSMQTLYARVGGGSQQREVADEADVVFSDTATAYMLRALFAIAHSSVCLSDGCIIEKRLFFSG